MTTDAILSTSHTTAEELEQILAAAEQAAHPLRDMCPSKRAALLEAIANELDAAAGRLIPLAQKETHLANERLVGELKRSSFQLRLFGQVLRDGAFLDARIDHPDETWPMGAPRPDLRRVMQPLGPVIVFAASNFPFAFSVAGGDTASALAAGNPVILKAHSGHPELSAVTAKVVNKALEQAGAPEGTFAIIFGADSGAAALKDRRVKAGAFTGSIPGGRALFEMATSRLDPIPFYGELGSNNPVFVTPSASSVRGQAIAKEFISSFTMGSGQFCTKPGTLLVPEGSAIIEILRHMELPKPVQMLNERIQEGYVNVLRELSAHPEVEFLAQGNYTFMEPPSPTLLLTTAAAVLADKEVLQSECFGPTALVVEYADEVELLQIAESFEGQLTATIQGEDDDEVCHLMEILSRKAGRLLWNQWPTGVSVTYAQQHGGPYPATTASSSTSVGTAAIERFLRPVAYQGFPDSLLPDALQEANPLGIPRLIDGKRVEGVASE